MLDMQIVKNIAQNAGHSMQNDGCTMPNVDRTMQNVGCTMPNVGHNTLNVCQGPKGGGAWGAPRGPPPYPYTCKNFSV